MKTPRFLLAISLTVGFSLPLSAQFNVQADGGVKIGTEPSTGNTILKPQWSLESKGLEVSVGELQAVFRERVLRRCGGRQPYFREAISVSVRPTITHTTYL